MTTKTKSIILWAMLGMLFASYGRCMAAAGSTGTLNVGATSFLNNSNSQSCFQNPPWDKYFVITNSYFCGKSVALQGFTNSTHETNCTMSTCDPANGTSLKTGIVIYYEFGPADKVCATNSCSITPANTNLTTCSRSMGDTKRYRATIFYQSGSLDAGRTNIFVKWSYP